MRNTFLVLKKLQTWGGGILRLIINLNGFSCAIKWID